MAAPCSHYEVLGVGQEATPELVKAAYQKLVLALHPDKVGDATHDSFQLLQQAWQVCVCALPMQRRSKAAAVNQACLVCCDTPVLGASCCSFYLHSYMLNTHLSAALLPLP
jgi:hypothetical protein